MSCTVTDNCSHVISLWQTAEHDIDKLITDMSGCVLQILPVPSFNIINGGSHAGNALAMQVSPPAVKDVMQHDVVYV